MAWSIFTDGGGNQVAVGWAQQFLTALGAPVTPGNVQFVYQWELAEGGGGKYNPLNTGPVKEHPEWTTTGEQFGGGAADYASWQTGILGPVYYLENYQQATYSKILNALRGNDPAGARAALWASPWAAGHYGYGADWPLNATVPGGQPILPSVSTASTSTSTTPVDFNKATCAWSFHIPVAGDQCILSKTQVRSIVGIGLMGTALLVGLVGVALLVAYGLKESSAGQAAQQAITSITPVGRVFRTAQAVKK